MDLQPFPPAQTHAASRSICSVDFKMYTDVGQVLVRFHQVLRATECWRASAPRRRSSRSRRRRSPESEQRASIAFSSLQQRMHRFLRFRINRCFALSQTARASRGLSLRHRKNNPSPTMSERGGAASVGLVVRMPNTACRAWLHLSRKSP